MDTESQRNYTGRTSHKKYLSKKQKYQSLPHNESLKHPEIVFAHANESDIPLRIAKIQPTHIWKTVWCLDTSSDCAVEVNLDKSNPCFYGIVIGDSIILWENQAVSIVERTSLLARYKWDTDRFNNRVLQPIAANVDLVVIVASAHNPKFQPWFIDRYMILAASANIPVLICITKSDLKSIDDPVLDYYEKSLHIPVLHTSSVSGVGMDELKKCIHNKTVVFVGKSGVGKSSLVNALMGSEITTTSNVSAQWWQWRHTTTSSHLYRLEDQTYIVDTPGIRSLEFLEFSWRELPFYFPEFVIPSQTCRYRDCTHLIEDECGVKLALRNGEIQEFRYKTYTRLMEETWV